MDWEMIRKMEQNKSLVIQFVKSFPEDKQEQLSEILSELEQERSLYTLNDYKKCFSTRKYTNKLYKFFGTRDVVKLSRLSRLIIEMEYNNEYASAVSGKNIPCCFDWWGC